MTYGGATWGGSAWGSTATTTDPAGRVVSNTEAGSSGVWGGAAYGSVGWAGDPEDTQEITRVSIPARSLTTSRNPVSATGDGQATADAPARALQATRQAVGAVGAGAGGGALPVRVLSLSRNVVIPTGDGIAGQTSEVGGGGTWGGTMWGGAVYGSSQPESQEDSAVILPGRPLEATRNAVSATGDGATPVPVPARSWSLTRNAVGAALLAALPTRDLEAARVTPTTTGVGQVSVSIPLRSLELSRPGVSAGFPNWVINNVALTSSKDEAATPQSLSITFRVDADTLDSALRPLKNDEGKVDVLPTDDGGFRAVDRANGDNTYRVFPPVGRKPLRLISDYHVAKYEESIVSTDAGEWDVGLELVRSADRDDSLSINQTRETGEWAFETRYGTIATPSVIAEFIGRGEGGVRRFELISRMTQQQARAFESAFNRINAARVREIPDATNVAVDDSDDDAATVTVTPPDTADEVPTGDYVVTEWESTRLNNAFQSVRFVIAEL